MGVNSKSRHRHGSEYVHCMCWPRVSQQIRAMSYHLLSPRRLVNWAGNRLFKVLSVNILFGLGGNVSLSSLISSLVEIRRFL